MESSTTTAVARLREAMTTAEDEVARSGLRNVISTASSTTTKSDGGAPGSVTLQVPPTRRRRRVGLACAGTHLVDPAVEDAVVAALAAASREALAAARESDITNRFVSDVHMEAVYHQFTTRTQIPRIQRRLVLAGVAMVAEAAHLETGGEYVAAPAWLRLAHASLPAVAVLGVAALISFPGPRRYWRPLVMLLAVSSFLSVAGTIGPLAYFNGRLQVWRHRRGRRAALVPRPCGPPLPSPRGPPGLLRSL